MIPTAPFPTRRLKYASTINDEALPESTASDFELAYIDIGNVDSQGRVHDIVNYRFEDAPSRARRIVRDRMAPTLQRGSPSNRASVESPMPLERGNDNQNLADTVCEIHIR